MKFHQNIPYDYLVMTRTRIVYDRQMDSAIIRPFFFFQNGYYYYLPIIKPPKGTPNTQMSSHVDSVHFFIALEFNDTSTLVGHFVISQRKGEKR